MLQSNKKMLVINALFLSIVFQASIVNFAMGQGLSSCAKYVINAFDGA
jgi:hypothetical protein